MLAFDDILERATKRERDLTTWQRDGKVLVLPAASTAPDVKNAFSKVGPQMSRKGMRC